LLPFNHVIEIVGLVWPLLGAQKQYIYDVAQHLFQRLAVFLVHRQQKGRDHGEHHHHGGGTDADTITEKKEQRDADQGTR
jgi:hypothetical protein